MKVFSKKLCVILFIFQVTRFWLFILCVTIRKILIDFHNYRILRNVQRRNKGKTTFM